MGTYRIISFQVRVGVKETEWIFQYG